MSIFTDGIFAVREMTRRIRENISCRAEYTLTHRDRVLFYRSTDGAAAEYEAEEERKTEVKRNEDISNYSGKDKRKSEGRHS